MSTNTECAMKQEFLNQIPGIPMVVMVMSCARSLHDPTQQHLSARAPYLYIHVTHVSYSEEPS